MRQLVIFIYMMLGALGASAQEETPQDLNLAWEAMRAGEDSAATHRSWRVADYALPSVALPDSNFLRLPDGAESPILSRFVDKMDSVLLYGRGRVSILHIGGSHVQADLYTDVFRHCVDSLNGGLTPPRGFVFPYRAAKTNNPLGYRTLYGGRWDTNRCARRQFTPTLGMGGIAISTQDTSAWFSIDLNRDSTGRWLTDQIHLLCRSTGGHLRPVITTMENATPLEGEREPTGYCFRLAHPTSYFRVSVATDSLWSRTAADTLVVTGVLPDNSQPGIVYHTIGVNGASVPSYLGCGLFEEELRLMRPDVVIMAIGINDATGSNFTDSAFCSNYNMLIRQIRRVSPDCAFLFITNNDSCVKTSRRNRKVNPNGAVARQAFYELARQWDGAVWDLFEVMGGLGSMGDWQKMGLAQRDRVHFTRAGYDIVGHMFYDAFLDFYTKY